MKTILFLLRLALGWLFLYAGLVKVLNPQWSAAGYLNAAGTFPDFFHWLAGPTMLPIINVVNEWGLTLLGASLILGLFVRLSSVLGAVLMALYYLAALKFPHPNVNAYIIDEHIIYILVLSLFAVIRVGRIWGLDSRFRTSLG